jgi:DNA polymerase/3'-5' exonuclease PolX
MQPLYGGAMHQASVSGDLERMRQTASDAEAFLREHGDVPAALEALRLEIARLESRRS